MRQPRDNSLDALHRAVQKDVSLGESVGGRPLCGQAGNRSEKATARHTGTAHGSCRKPYLFGLGDVLQDAYRRFAGDMKPARTHSFSSNVLSASQGQRALSIQQDSSQTAPGLYPSPRIFVNFLVLAHADDNDKHTRLRPDKSVDDTDSFLAKLDFQIAG